MAKGESLSLSVDALDANNAGLVMVSEDETPSFSALPGVEVGYFLLSNEKNRNKVSTSISL